MLRAVIDTNIWVSALLNPTGAPSRVLDAFIRRAFTSVTCELLLDELDAVLARPRIARKYEIAAADRMEYVDLLRLGSIVVPINGSVQLCRDPDDDAVIESAVQGKADVLVSRDDDLKNAREVITFLDEVGVQVLTVQKFLDLMEPSG